MPRDDADQPFDELFRELERMMNEMMGGADVHFDSSFDSNFSSTDASDTHVDVQDAGDELRVIADLPGVKKDDIKLECDGTALTITASTDRRQYDERVRLPRRVDPQSASATYKNGVLEVVFDPVDEAADIDVE